MTEMKKTINFICIISLCLLITACENILDLEPKSIVVPENYLKEEAHLASYVINYYGMIGSHSSNPTGSAYWRDNTKTDNAIGRDGSTTFLPGELKVEASGGVWNFDKIRAMNYYLEIVLPRYKAGEISGNPVNIKHYIGEGYFLRAWDYFDRLRQLGDFPIITKVLPDVQEELVKASRRCPRNEVARFIIADLDTAINMLSNTPPGGRVRITKNAALLLKARVALFEASWLKYHAETALVPQGPGWPGKTKDYVINTVSGEQNIKDYQFPTSDGLQGEIDYFYGEAMKAAYEVAEAVPLVDNTKTIRSSMSDPVNPYYDMFATTDPMGYSEAIMYRTYAGTVKHSYNMVMQGYSNGYTHQMERAFLMENGLPWYAEGSNYGGDDYVQDTKKNRDWRWRLFMKAPGDPRALFDSSNDNFAVDTYPNPPEIHKRDQSKSTSTGYLLGKGVTYDYHSILEDWTSFIVFRAAEAYLIYIEASYEKTGEIDEFADKYWRALRRRAGVDEEYMNTVNATNMAEEAKTDWAAYSHGKLLDDLILYNIRRERRCELIGEGFRWDDLIRWRAMDQLNGFQLEGCKIWGPMKDLYKKSDLLYNQSTDSKNTVSDPELSDYLRLMQISRSKTNRYFDGYSFIEAHYLSPIAQQHFLITAVDGQTKETSPIYQNPHWPLNASEGPVLE